MEQKLLVVVSIMAGRNFPRRPECSLEVEARFNGEVLCTDPLPHAGGTMVIDTELAWEMTRRALQQHKLNRTPIKLQCYAVDSATKNRQNVGYVMLDLRTAHPKSQQLQEPSWYGVLNSTYSRLRPQLQVALTLEEEDQSSPPMTLPSQIQETHDDVPSLSLTLDPSGGYYHLLPSLHSALKPDHQEQQLMYTLSLTLSNAKQLPKLAPDQAQYYFYYCLLGNDITSEPFTPPTFSPERASIRLKSSRDLLSLLLASQPDLEIHLCCGSDSIAKASFSLKSLASKDTLQSTLRLNQTGATVDITVHIEQASEVSVPTSSTSAASYKAQASQLSPSKAPPTSTASGSKVTATPPHSSRSARRNLTRSFEEASLNTPSSKTTSGSSSSAQSTPPPPPTTKATTTSTTTNSTSQSPAPQPDESGQTIHQDGFSSPLPPPTTASPLPSSHIPTTQLTTIPQHSLLSGHLSLAQDTKATYTSSLPLPMSTVHVPTLSSAAPPISAPVTIPVSKVGPLPGFGIAHRYKFSVDLRSIHNTALDSGIRCYLRYNYPFFGCPYPVVVQPPVPLSLNTDQAFTQSYCAFDFATEPQQLIQHISSHPLVVEVWQSCDKSHDLIVGTSKVMLGEVLSMNKVVLEGEVTRQIYSLRSPIIPPPPSHHHSLHLTLGHINIVLVLEDHGPIGQSNDSTSLVSAQSLPIMTAPQNLTSTETAPIWTSRAVPQANIDVPQFVTGVGGQYTNQMFDQSVAHPQIVNPSHHGYLPPSSLFPQPAQDTNVHVPVTAVAPSIGSVVGSAEYSAAMELEMWKLTEEEAFQEQLKTREKTHMAKLGEEWQKREEQRQQLLRQKLEHYSSLEKELQEALAQVQAQQKQLSERETKFIREKDKLVQERQLFQKEMEGAVLQVRTQYEHQLEIERLKSSELQSHIDSLKKQVRDLESRLSSREVEFEKYRQQIVAKPESKLQAELSITQLEKAELERKLLALSKSKQHYKEQWSKALGELAACRQREQAAARERLLAQQQELEMMRARYLQHEEQNSIRQQLHRVKNEVEQLQEQTLFHQVQQKQATAGSSSKPNSPTAEQNVKLKTKPHAESNVVSTNVARWIEERDILLQTGVYTSSDPTIQKLDLKIRQALAEHADST